MVHFTIDGVPSSATATANAQGVWTFTPSGLSDGAHTIVASQTDSFGNTGSASLTFTLDTTAPTVAITSAGGPTNQASQTITGTVDVADAGATVTILDGATPSARRSCRATAAGAASVTLATAQLADGPGQRCGRQQRHQRAVIYTLSTDRSDGDRGAGVRYRFVGQRPHHLQ